MYSKTILCHGFNRIKPTSFNPMHISSYRYANNNFIVLGIETSCDDTGTAIIDQKGNLFAETLLSQNVIHLRYGGVNPLIARDLHRDNIERAVNETVFKAKLHFQDIDAIAVTVKPGLLFSLQIGVKYAKYLSKIYHKPLIPIHHMEAHALVARMYNNIDFPFLALLISGGHCLLTCVRGTDDFLLLGDTLDNAPGEVLDKVARRMKLRNIPDYSQLPGGRSVELAAENAKTLELFEFPLPLHKQRDCNFSFSGLKDAFSRHLYKKESEHNIKGDEIIPEVNELCASFQYAIAKHIVHRAERALKFCISRNYIPENNGTLVVSGGVASNDFIFKCLQCMGYAMKCNVFRPPPKLCTDNGIMIAWNGIEKINSGYSFTDMELIDIDPIAPLGLNVKDEVRYDDIHVKSTRLKNMFITP
ncbi:probable tRNA N6-adenosine threonylcarbamoyltransferase, mitochondrial [Pieris brassicae]|uniref:probable tRNA N6-adenosine threonylcarbamoyltransferase, mitochondrial n=1 Tax=Pieris brassicae TaxID=7116 RepID=UPI001E661988|nr:probable tRNA N6-adenosine threonylcarbamoyltransferase, mitochondrial [Pieris brassicae]